MATRSLISQLHQVHEDEKKLIARGVPRCYWAYLAHNPGINDGFGTWTPDRDWIVKDAVRYPGALEYHAVDGRDKAAVLHDSWICGCPKKIVAGAMVSCVEATWYKWLVSAGSSKL